MAKEKNATANPLFRELFQAGIYKRSQGRIARQTTFAALAIVVGVGAWRLGVYLMNSDPRWAIVPGVLLLVGLWLSFRLVNLPAFADFLIAVEAEMNKVSWPTRGELFRSSVVVIMLIFLLGFVLYGYDVTWQLLLKMAGVLGV